MVRCLEVCVDSFESAMNAIAGGAGRIELCSALSEGGLTPTAGFLKVVQDANPERVPVVCMLRCRRGSDFIYTSEEFAMMIEDAKTLKQAGADGFVFGALKEDGDVDLRKCRQIIRICYPLPVTFNRAFDVCKNPQIALEALVDIGFQRVLTSGQSKSALDGADSIKKWITKANGRILVMPGCGVNGENLKEILEKTGATEVHASCRVKKVMEEEKKTTIPMGGPDDEEPLLVSDVDKVKQLVRILKSADIQVL